MADYFMVLVTFSFYNLKMKRILYTFFSWTKYYIDILDVSTDFEMITWPTWSHIWLRVLFFKTVSFSSSSLFSTDRFFLIEGNMMMIFSLNIFDTSIKRSSVFDKVTEVSWFETSCHTNKSSIMIRYDEINDRTDDSGR